MRVLAVAFLAAGCAPSMAPDAAVSRAELVRMCADGTGIGRDPVSQRLVWSRWNGSGYVAKGVRISDVCDGRKG